MLRDLLLFAIINFLQMSEVVSKVILVTGANKGIGRAICKRILIEFPGTHVLLGSRDQARGEQAVESILEHVGEEARSRFFPPVLTFFLPISTAHVILVLILSITLLITMKVIASNFIILIIELISLQWT